MELRNHLNRNIFALEEIFKNDFESDFVDEVKYTFDFNWMIELKESITNETKSMTQAFDEVEIHGNSTLEFLLLRQSKTKPPSIEEIAKVVHEFKLLKEYAFKIIMGIEMDRNMRVIKENALV